MATLTPSSHCFELGQNPVRFDPVSIATNVFFDDLNKQVFAVRSGGETIVTVKGPTDKNSLSFQIKDKGPLISIKFSARQKILAIQRNDRAVEFANFINGATDPIEYSQTCKGRTNRIKTFHWINSTDIVFVTEMGVEFYQANIDKRFLRFLKSYPLTVNWALFSPDSSIILASTTETADTLAPFQFQAGQIVKLHRFEADISHSHKPTTSKLQERDVILLNVYGCMYAGILKHPPPSSTEKCLLSLYLLLRDTVIRKTYVLRLGMVGRFAFSVVDNLIVAHHQVSKTSMLFDVKLPGVSKSNVVYLDPLINPLPIRPFLLKGPASDLSSKTALTDRECDLYSATWIVFQPDVIIDAALGCMWYLKVALSDMLDMFSDQCVLIDFLLSRNSSKSSILRVCRQAICPEHQLPIGEIDSMFSKLNQRYKDYVEAEQAYIEKLENQCESPIPATHKSWVVVDQNDLFTNVLAPFVKLEGVSWKFKQLVLIEYVRSLDNFKINIQHFIYVLLVESLVKGECYHELQQLIWHDAIEISQPLAALLYSLEAQHPPCYDLALEMYKQLATCDDKVIDILLSKKKVMAALRFVRSVGMIDLVPARDFLKAAMHDDMLFYNAYKFFEARNIRLNGKPEFTAAERCDEFMIHYVSRFASDYNDDD